MEDEGPTLLDRLIAYNKVVKIKVRVCRIWRPRHPGLGNKYAGLHCILVDEKEEAKLTLWSDIAHSFSSVSLEALSQPTVALFTSLRVKLYADNIILTSTGSLFFIDPDTPELNSYKSVYKVFLVLEDETNEINALIIGKSGKKVFGTTCKDLVFNQTSVDQKQLPSEFLRLIGQRKICHLRFGTRRNLLNSNDFLIYNIYEDTMIQPATPQSISREITISSTTVSSSTTHPETTGESHKRKRESIKKALFTTFEKSNEGEEISEVDMQDFNQVPIKLLKKKSSPTSSKTLSFPEQELAAAPRKRHLVLY